MTPIEAPVLSEPNDAPATTAAEPAGAKAPAGPRPTTRRAKRPRARWNAFMLFLRRVHLYSGLFLIPWVMVYAISAILFNHGTWFTDADYRDLDASGPRMAAQPLDATTVAREILAAIDSGSAAQLDLAEAPRWSDALVEVEDESHDHLIRFDPETGEGTVRTREKSEPRPRSPFPRSVEWEPRDDYVAEVSQNGVPAVEALGLHGEEAELSRGPSVHFTATTPEGEAWNLSYDVSRESLRARPATREFDAREFVLRLHMTHGYPDRVSPHLFWVIGADILAIAFVVWAFSGLAMWVQMKKLRVWGLVTLGASLLTAGALGWGMFRALYG